MIKYLHIWYIYITFCDRHHLYPRNFLIGNEEDYDDGSSEPKKYQAERPNYFVAVQVSNPQVNLFVNIKHRASI